MKNQKTFIMKNAKTSVVFKPSRPYTEYNIFFQLEREYILQASLGLKPSIDACRVFDPSRKDYFGPDLPARYKGIILMNDWHIPGKNRRRNRQHTKSHGLISFTDLSKRVSKAWANAGSDVREFCAELREIGMKQYRAKIASYSKTFENTKAEVSKKAKEIMTHVQKVEHVCKNPDSSEFANGSSCFTHSKFEAEAVAGTSTMKITDLNESVNVLVAHFGAGDLYEDPNLFVEMHDDEIRKLWMVSRPPLVADDDSLCSGIKPEDSLRFADSRGDSVSSSAGDIVESVSEENYYCFGGANRNPNIHSSFDHLRFCCRFETDNDSNAVGDCVDRSIEDRQQTNLTTYDFCCGECGYDSPRPNKLAHASIVSPGPSPYGKEKKSVFDMDTMFS